MPALMVVMNDECDWFDYYVIGLTAAVTMMMSVVCDCDCDDDECYV